MSINKTTCRVAWLASLLVLLPAAGALADIWKWVDPLGNTRYVETLTPIFTWIEDGRVYFSDIPDHEDAIAVQLVWHSRGTLADLDEDGETEGAAAPETPEERAARLEAEKKYCARVKEIYESYVNAPRMYKTNDKGEREYLSEREVRNAIREIDAVKKMACK